MSQEELTAMSLLTLVETAVEFIVLLVELVQSKIKGMLVSQILLV